MSRAERNPFKLTESDIYEAFSSLLGNNNNNNVTGNLQTSLNFLSARDTGNINNASNALDALQGYGPGIQSPSYITNYDRNADSTNKPFSNIHLNSVEEEDEFLYGDSNSVDEENVSTKEDAFVINTSRHNTGWSDEEDPYSESSGPALNKLSSRLKKNLSNCDSQNKNYETEKFYVKRDLIEDNVPPAKTAEQKYRSHHLESDTAALSPKTEINQFPVSETSSLGKNKSKYHVAAEILKKRIGEKTNSSPSEKLSTFSGPGTSKSFSELEYQSAPTDLKNDKPVIKKQITKTINKKHLANIRDYITGPQRKRVHPREELGPEKHPRYESRRSSSPSRYSTQKSSLPSYKHKSSHVSSEIDRLKYASPYSRHRSPSYEYERRHSKYSESHRRYSRSPKRWSHEKSPDYRRRDRSPRSRRSRSRSPGYYPSRSKTYEKKKMSPKKSDYYSKKKEKSGRYSSAESFCSLSLGSSSSSSSSSSTSDESSDEKKKSKKSSKKVTSKDNRKLEDEIVILKDCDDTHSIKPDNTLSGDISKEPDVFNAKNSVVSSDLLNSENVAHLVSALQPSDINQRLLEFLEGLQQQQQQPSVAVSHSTHTSPADLNIPSNLQMPVISTSESYAYPTVPAAPVQYMASQMPNFPQMIPPSAFPASVMTPMASTQYGPYLSMPPVPSSDSQYITNVVSKSGKVRPTTLRPVPMSDGLQPPGVNTNILPKNPSLQKSVNSSLETTKSKPQESKLSSKFSKQSSEKRNKNFKEFEKNANSSREKSLVSSSEKNINSSYEKKLASSSEKNNNSSSKQTSESTSEQNKNLIIEKFKRMKNERAEAINKSKSASEDLDEMRKMLDETFGKRINDSEKNLYTRCKTLLNLCLDTASTFNENARRSDEDLNKFKAKLPTSLQAEVSKIKLEQCKEEPVTNETYSCLDQGDHYCYDCHIQFKNVKGFLIHIQTAEHKQRMETSKNEWKKDFIKEQKQDSGDQKKAVLKAIKGAEFLKPLTGFYCSLCKEVILDELTTEQHVKSHQHYVNYMNHMEYPLFERPVATKSSEKILKKEDEQKMEIIKENIETTHKNETKTDENKINLTEISKDNHSSDDENLSDVQKILSGKEKPSIKSDNCTKVIQKTVHKFVFIGKNPSYKKKIAERNKPWYKRESILSKNDKDSQSDVAVSPKLKENIVKQDQNTSVKSNDNSVAEKKT